MDRKKLKTAAGAVDMQPRAAALLVLLDKPANRMELIGRISIFYGVTDVTADRMLTKGIDECLAKALISRRREGIYSIHELTAAGHELRSKLMAVRDDPIKLYREGQGPYSIAQETGLPLSVVHETISAAITDGSLERRGAGKRGGNQELKADLLRLLPLSADVPQTACLSLELCCSRQRVSLLLVEMETEGLVKKMPVPENGPSWRGRSNSYKVTPKGSNFILKATAEKLCNKLLLL